MTRDHGEASRGARRSRVGGWMALICALSLGALVMGWSHGETVRPLTGATAQEAMARTGPSGLALPRFVSLKADRVNVRTGPGRDHRIAWTFTREGLPVEIVAEFDNWRRIRDSEGAEGWVFHSLLSGRRTGVVAPWSDRETLALRHRASDGAEPAAYLEPGVLIDVQRCDGAWCRVGVGTVNGWIEQELLWGVYPREEIP